MKYTLKWTDAVSYIAKGDEGREAVAREIGYNGMDFITREMPEWFEIDATYPIIAETNEEAIEQAEDILARFPRTITDYSLTDETGKVFHEKHDSN